MRYEKPVVVEAYFDTVFERDLHRVLCKYANFGYDCDVEYSCNEVGGIRKYSAVVIPHKE